MLDLKQLQYFVKCAQTESFSQAAEQLYTTQPSVSRVIKSMEEELGEELFARNNKGITLTPEGEHVYKYACKILDSMEKLSKKQDNPKKELLRIASNPSSWIADRFLEFYQLHKEKPYYYTVQSAGSREVVERVQERLDDLGLVFVMESQLPAFQYYLKRNYLEFEVLTLTDATLYYNPEQVNLSSESIDFKEMRLIQRFTDEYSADNYWNVQDKEGHSAADAEIVVTTNSDYIMQRMLRQSDLVNISGEFRGNIDTGIGKRRLDGEQNSIVLGYLHRIGEDLPGCIQKFVDYLKQVIEEKAR